MEERHTLRRINDILEACTTTVEQETRARWKFVLRNGVEVGAVAHYDADWLSLMTVPVASKPARRDGSALHLLTLNGMLPGGTKFARVGDGTTVGILGDVPLEPEIDLARRVTEVCEGFVIGTEAHALVFDRRSAGLQPADVVSICGGLIAERVPGADDAPAWTTPAMSRLCTEAGWEGSARGEERVVVDLDVPGRFRQATLSGVGGRGGLRVAIDLEPCPTSAADRCRIALGVLLLHTCGIMRMVRVAVDVRVDRIIPRFEVCFDSAPGSAELARALAALSIACRVSADEAEAVQRDERLAEIYMATRGVSAEAAREDAGRSDRRPKARGGGRVNATTSRRSVRVEGSTTS
jgi:hypothetical protein